MFPNKAKLPGNIEPRHWQGMVDRVHVSTVEATNIVKHSAKVVSPSEGVNLFN